MRFRLLLLVLAAAPFLYSSSLDSVETIYILPMANGLDQYLANRLVQGHRFQIVADPAQADAIFTDRLGASFESRLDELYPSTKPAPAKAGDKGETDPSQFVHEPAPVRVTSFGRSRGNVFLVDRNSKRVIWSHYKLPKNARPAKLNKLADSLGDRLEKEAGPIAKATIPSMLPPPPAAVPAPPAPAASAPAASAPAPPTPAKVPTSPTPAAAPAPTAPAPVVPPTKP